MRIKKNSAGAKALDMSLTNFEHQLEQTLFQSRYKLFLKTSKVNDIKWASRDRLDTYERCYITAIDKKTETFTFETLDKHTIIIHGDKINGMLGNEYWTWVIGIM